MDAETARECALLICEHCRRYGEPVQDAQEDWVHYTGNTILTRWFACKAGPIWDRLSGKSQKKPPS